MRSLLLFISRGVLVCLFMAILRAHALVVIPPEALPVALRTPEAGDDAFSQPAGSESGMAPHPAAYSLLVPPIPTVPRVLPSPAQWHVQTGAPGHARGTQRTMNGRIRIQDAELKENVNALYAYHDHHLLDLNSAPWAAKHRESESSPGARRHRPDGVDDATGPDRTSDDSKLSVLAVAVVGIVLACHYLDYL